MLSEGNPIGRSPQIQLRNMHATYIITWYPLLSVSLSLSFFSRSRSLMDSLTLTSKVRIICHHQYHGLPTLENASLGSFKVHRRSMRTKLWVNLPSRFSVQFFFSFLFFKGGLFDHPLTSNSSSGSTLTSSLCSTLFWDLMIPTLNHQQQLAKASHQVR